LITGLIAPDTPEAGWILKEFEDNLYISDTYGYDIANFAEFWFSRGGFSMQANLLEGPVPYLQRDEIKHFLRAYFNGFASAFYPEIRMCNEHSKPELGYPVGDHFKSSDESNVTCWLRLMFVREQGNELYLGQGIPRYWLAGGRSVGIDRAATHFGPMSLTISSNADAPEIKAVLTDLLSMTTTLTMPMNTTAKYSAEENDRAILAKGGDRRVISTPLATPPMAEHMMAIPSAFETNPFLLSL